MAVHYEEESNYEQRHGDPKKLTTMPVKRLRWATQRASKAQGANKRRSIMQRLHKRAGSDRTATSDATGGGDSNAPSSESEADDDSRTIYFNRPLPASARDEDGHPLYHFMRNKVRTAKYTPLSFIPKNLWLQFHNIANVYFLFIIILSIFPIFGASNPGLSAVPLIVILTVTAVKDAIEDTRRTILDNELNNTPIHRLTKWKNVNTAEDKVSLWRKLKKATTKAIMTTWGTVFRRGRKKGPVERYAERALDEGRPSRESRPSMRSDRTSFHSATSRPLNAATEDIQMEPVAHQEESRHAQAHTDEKAPAPAPKRFYGSLIDPTKTSEGKASFTKDYWKNLQVGDFVRLYNEDQIPADIVVLSTSDPDGACYVETKNLDGETNLKVRQALHCGRQVKRAKDCERTDFWIESEGPHANLYSYSAVARWHQHDAKNPAVPTTEMAEPVGINNLLLRGCNLRNTEWILGVVVFTGDETKIMINSGITPSKRAKISRDLNWNVIYNFIILFFMCLVAALVEGTYWGKSGTSVDYFEYGGYGSTPALNGFITFWAGMILFQNLVPISLYISLEIIRTAQAFFIYSDTWMYYEKIDYPCTPKSWNIADDLGQIEYIFSDKTGTLTQNVMEFKKATIGSEAYGEAYTEAQAGMQKRQGINVEEEGAKARAQIALDRQKMLTDLRAMHDNPYLIDDDLTFVAPDFVADLRGDAGQERKQINEQFMLALALCHTVITERTPGDPPRIEFKAQSPDEAALVATARDCGFTVIGRSDDGIIVNVMGEEREYTVLNTLEFNSTRKRMSAIMRMPDGKIMLFCKGADSVIFSRLRAGEQQLLRRTTAEHLEMFAREGLRTLCIAQKEIPEEVYQEWNKEHDLAAAAVQDREEKLEVVSDAIERDLTLLGGTAIEDRLQDGVPDAIALLGNAGIKLWVLTGDKVETAINIGFSCNLLNNDMDMIVFNIEDGSMDTAEAELDKNLTIFGMTGSDEELEAAKKNHEPPGPTHGIVIDGESLKLMLDDKLRQKFLLLCKQCKSVLCCRVSPSQKAAVVQMVKRGLDVMTLSIGDGANDVAMIQEADVGVGIAGEEGRQAVMSSDFAIGQFRFLARLMLVHGRWCYRRMGETIANFFYKNIVWTFSLFWYNIYDNYDCSYIFDYSYILLYNLAFTSLTVIFLGILDQDVSDKVSLAVPQLYRRGIERKEWTQPKFWIYMFDGLYQSFMVFFLPYLLFSNATFNTSTGLELNDNKRMGVYIAHAAIVVVNVYILLNTYRWDWAILLVALISILLIWMWTGIYTSFTYSYRFYKAAAECYGQLSFWAITFLVVVICLLPRFAAKSYQKIYRPYDIDIVREQVRQGKFDYLEEHSDPALGPTVPAEHAKSVSDDSSASEKGVKRRSMRNSKSRRDTSDAAKPNGNAADQRRDHAGAKSEDERPMIPEHPPSTSHTNATGMRTHPHSQQNSDDSYNAPAVQPTSPFDDRPRISTERTMSFERARPSYDRARAGMDRIRPSFELSRDFSSAAFLTRVESSHSDGFGSPTSIRGAHSPNSPLSRATTGDAASPANPSTPRDQREHPFKRHGSR